MRYLVTGGCGFIGSHLAEALVAAGAEVRVFDNLSTGREEHLAAVRERVELVRGDVRDPDALRAAMEGVEGVFHQAALVSVFESMERPRDNHEINLTGTFNVLLAARERKVRRVVAASSAAVYGNEPTLPKREDLRPQPESPYAAAKLAGEHYLAVFARRYGLETVSLRYFNVYGPRQDPSSMYSGVISRFAEALRADAPPTVFGDGRQTRDFVFVKDVVQANLLAMRAPGVGRGEALNIGTGRRTSLLELLEALSALSGRALNPRFHPARAGDIRHSVAEIARARLELGYEPAYDIRQGLAELLAAAGEKR